MSDRASRRLAWGLAASAVLLMLGAEALALATGAGAHRSPGSGIFIWAIVLVFSAVGALIASRRPGNAIGWLFLGAGVAAGSIHWRARTPTTGSTARNGPAAAWQAAALYGDLSWIPCIVVPSTFLLLLFPDGRLLSRRWRPVAGAPRRHRPAASWPGGLHAGRMEDRPQLDEPVRRGAARCSTRSRASRGSCC